MGICLIIVCFCNLTILIMYIHILFIYKYLFSLRPTKAIQGYSIENTLKLSEAMEWIHTEFLFFFLEYSRSYWNGNIS